MQMNLFLDKPQQLICEVLASHNHKQHNSFKRLFDMLGCEEMFNFATKNEIAPMLFHSFNENVPSHQLHWETSHKRNSEKLSAFCLELDRIAELFSNFEIQLIALKNAGIARGIYPCPGCCPMGDLDVLVNPKNFRDAHKLLLKDGYTFEFRSPLEEAELEVAIHGGGSEYWKMLPSGEKLWFELQWRPVAGRWLRPEQEPNAEELISRSIPIPGTKVRLLSPEDNLLQVALHTAKHTFIRAPGFRLHLDVDRIVCYQKVDWEVFAERVVELKVKTPVYFSLFLPKEFFGTPIPDSVFDLLRPQRWKEYLILKWLKKAGIFNPEERKFGRIGYIIFNMLLYDDCAGLLRSIFPDNYWMMQHYKVKSRFFLPFYHAKRIVDLVFRRMKT